MSTDTMSTTDNQVLAEILSTLKGLSPPSILGTINESIKNLNGSFDKSIKPLIDAVDLVTQSVDLVTEAIGTLKTDLTSAIGTLKTDLTEVIKESTTSITDALKPNWILEGLNLVIGVLGLFKVETLEKMLKKITPIISNIISAFKALVPRILALGPLIMGVLAKVKPAISKIGSAIKALGPLIMGIFTSMKTAMIPVLRSLAMMTANFVRVGLSALVTGAQMAAAWITGLGPIAWVIAIVVGVFALVAANIDYLQGAWGKFVSWFSTSFPDLSKLLEPVTNTITWILEKIKQITEFGGGIVDKLFGKNPTDQDTSQSVDQVTSKKSARFFGWLSGKDSTDQVAPPVIAQQVIAPISAPSTALLPMTPTSINQVATQSSTHSSMNYQSIESIAKVFTDTITKVFTEVFTNTFSEVFTKVFTTIFHTSSSSSSSSVDKLTSNSLNAVTSNSVDKVATVVNTPNNQTLVSNDKNISPVTFNTSMFSNNSSHGGTKGATSSKTNSTHHHQNVYNIANIDIADGMISDLEDLIQAINRHAC